MRIVVFDFTGLYERQKIFPRERVFWLDVRGISGTDCYCDQEAQRRLSDLMAQLGPEGIHFLESGNYHYLTKLWIDQIREPFELAVFDNHTDMLPPAFGEILSCGGWLYEALRETNRLSHVILAGPSEAAWQETAAQIGEIPERVSFVSQEALMGESQGLWRELCQKGLQRGLPLYLSLDKDVLCPSQVQTNWDQGIMTFDSLFSRLEELCQGRNIIGWDICGESGRQELSREEWKRNKQADESILSWLENKSPTPSQVPSLDEIPGNTYTESCGKIRKIKQ